MTKKEIFKKLWPLYLLCLVGIGVAVFSWLSFIALAPVMTASALVGLMCTITISIDKFYLGRESLEDKIFILEEKQMFMNIDIHLARLNIEAKEQRELKEKMEGLGEVFGAISFMHMTITFLHQELHKALGIAAEANDRANKLEAKMKKRNRTKAVRKKINK